jgi:hypothetical protein
MTERLRGIIFGGACAAVCFGGITVVDFLVCREEVTVIKAADGSKAPWEKKQTCGWPISYRWIIWRNTSFRTEERGIVPNGDPPDWRLEMADDDGKAVAMNTCLTLVICLLLGATAMYFYNRRIRPVT